MRTLVDWLRVDALEARELTEGMYGKPEAEFFADIAREKGVPDEVILVEPNSTNTGENIRMTRALCEQRDLEVKSAILVSKPNMNRRGLATCQLFWPEIEVACSAPDTHFLHNPAPDHQPP